MLDIKIIGGTIVDGTGRPRFSGDVGIRDGRIVAVGRVAEAARETIDAGGRIVAPGFIDVHTHYDAQAFWDPTLSPSCYHGITTVIGGFCGFSIAPLTDESASYVKPMLARVEGMPLETLDRAVPWDWSSFGQFLDKLEGRIGLNAGFYAGHSAIRRIAMGERAVGEKATRDDIARMKSLLDASLAEGALGFSTTVSPSHLDGDGQPVPSRWADPSEFIELARVVSKHEGTGLELLPDLTFGPGTAELLADFSIAGQRPVNWNVLVVRGDPQSAERVERQLRVSDFARARGGEVIALTVPSVPCTYMTLASNTFDNIPGVWRDLLKLPLPERIAKFQDAAIRDRMAGDAQAFVDSGAMMSMQARFDNFLVVTVVTPANKHYEGRKVGEIAKEEGKRPLDVILDLAIADNLATIFAPDPGGEDRASYELRGRIWADDRTLIGASDAGAHLDLIDSFAFSTTVLQKGVREYGVISLEEAVRQMTERPATYFGLVDRGVIAEGKHADIVVFDEARVTRGPTYFRYDLPGTKEAFRIYADAVGIEHVLVNGVPIVREGTHTGKLPGTVLRSGRDTRTVALDAMRERRA